MDDSLTAITSPWIDVEKNPAPFEAGFNSSSVS